MFDPDGRVTMAAITEAMWANTPENSNSYWFNNGSGFTSYDGGDKGGKAGGGSLAYGSTVSYGSIFTMGDGIYTLPPLVLNGYGSSKNWGVTVNNYNNNHNILYNGIAGMQSAWNYANRPFDPLGAVKADGPIQFIGGTGDPLGLFDIAGQIISNWEPENRYLAMGAGVIGGIALKKPGLAVREVQVEANILRHYTTEAGYKAIMESGELLPSIGIKNARHGSGQYLTDLMSQEFTKGQASRRLFGVPWNSKKMSHFIELDVSGLNVTKNGPYNFLIPGNGSLPLQGIIVNHGPAIFR